VLNGILPVLQTPFGSDSELDFDALARLVEFAAASGANAVVYPANASEFYTLTADERRAAVTTVVSVAKTLPVIACVTAPTASEAAAYAQQAASLGATAVMTLPTYRSDRSLDELIAYFAEGVAPAGLPIVLQNVGQPYGAPLDDGAIDHLLDAVPEIAYIKEERTPTTQRISQLIGRYDGRLSGVIGGANGQWLVQESLRGACGCMPAGALIDLQVPVQRAIDTGDWPRARALQARLQPLLSYTSIYGISMVKETLRLRGLIAESHVRDPKAVPLDATDRSELKRYLDELIENAVG
jgi:4-hydroxy-tetrahydrodipicolinate synthase